MKMYNFRLWFYWSVLLRDQVDGTLQYLYDTVGFVLDTHKIMDYGLSPGRRQAINWTNGGIFYDTHMLHSASMR